MGEVETIDDEVDESDKTTKTTRMLKKMFYQSVTQATRKHFLVLPTQLQPMTFRTPFGRPTTDHELQETRGS